MARTSSEKRNHILHEKYSNLADMDVINVLKVIGVTSTFMRGVQREVTELGISIAFPLVILQCRSLANLLASLSNFDDEAPHMAWHSHHASILGGLVEDFDSLWRHRWQYVFRRWQSEGNDYEGLNRKIEDLRSKLAELRPIFASIKEAFNQIDNMTGTSLVDIASPVQEAFNMFNNCLAECAEKANKMRLEEERQKHLSPYSNTSHARSWTSGASPPSSGIAKRTSFGRKNNHGVQTEVNTNRNTQQRWPELREQLRIDNSDEDHWTRLFGLFWSPVILILMTALAPTIYSTILC
ncbi:hypothetical protein F53441_1497 [Fusarium austroafricanum]|uniref:Uncharacterized protein n=1 Tax=Fusarium austroafricanum TaxID=2364996 RepID=A0A8H4KV79_9HYPO|nr:hypothetical protein F53441_1497 [Fusarium austroafricanum]